VAEILLIDMESTDRTVELARPYATRILTHPVVPNFDAARNVAIPEAHFDWLWFHDADERIPVKTGDLVRQVLAEQGPEIVAITIPFKSYFCGKWIEHCGWWPGYTMPRVLKRGHFRFSERLHKGVEFTGREVRLPPDPEVAIEHFSYESIEQYIEKFNRYTSTEAGYLAEQGQTLDWQTAFRAMMRDLWLYYEKGRGHLDGNHGWILSWLAGQYRWFSHAKLLDLHGSHAAGSSASSGAQSVSVPPNLDAVIQLMAHELTTLQSREPQLPLGIVWRSPIWDPSGYADDSRLFLKSLAKADRELAAEEILWSDATCVLPEPDTTLLRALARCKRPAFTATITNCIPTLCEPDRCASLNILRTTFETDRIPGDWLPILERFDEVWVFSKQNEQSFRRSGVAPEKLRRLPGFTDTALFTSRGKKISLPQALEDRFVFLSVFDWQRRKGWDVLLSAYCTEFSPDEGVGLLLKITMAHGHAQEIIREQADAVLGQFSQSLEERDDIVLWDETLDTADMAALYRSADAFVLASRGEGWGRPYMEAMASGLPTIGTRGSGNDDFMNDGNSFLVSTTLIDVPDAAADEIQVYRGHRWLEPDLSELRSTMRHVATDERSRKAKARKAISDIRGKFSVDCAREAVEQNLRAAEQRFLSKEPPDVQQSQIRVQLEGEFFAGHSFSNINEKLSLKFIKDRRVALSLNRLQHNPTYDSEACHARQLLLYMDRALPDGPDVTIRHAFPPNWTPPERGHWVHIQPWEYGTLPIAWVPPLRDHVDEIWAPSNYVKRVYERSGIPAEKIHVIPWGVEPDVYHPGAPPLLVPTSRRFSFLFVGGTIPRKGFDLVLDGYLSEFTKDDDVCLVVKDVGTSTFYRYGNLREQVLQAIADDSTPDIVYVERNMTEGQLASLYSACDCLVAPYRGEGFGLPILEAMACGLPAIVPVGGASDDFVTDATGYLLPAHQVECQHDWRLCGVPTELSVKLSDVRTAMRQAFNNSKENSKKGELASEHVRDTFTWENTARLMIERIEHLANCSEPVSSKPSARPPVEASVITPTISLCMLCHNNENTIGDSLGRIRPFVDEVVVLDLGSNDRSRQVAGEYDARVYQGQLADDIGSLRNATIRRATSDWILVLDADELLDERETEKILGLLKSIPDDVLGVRFHVRPPESPGTSDSCDREVRLFRNRNEINFDFRACEQVDQSVARIGGRILETDVHVRWSDRDGSLPCYRSSQTLLRLLHLDLADRPDDARVLFNLGKLHFRLGNFFNAECYLNDCLQRSKPDNIHYRTAAVRLIHSHIKKGDPFRAREVGEFVQKQIPDDQEFTSRISALLASMGEQA